MLADRVRVPYAAAAELPKGARDTGFRRAGAALRVGKGRRVRRHTGTRAERLPAAEKQIICA